MQATSIKALLAAPDAQIGKQLEVRGWLRSRRDSKADSHFSRCTTVLPRRRFRWWCLASWRITRVMCCG